MIRQPELQYQKIFLGRDNPFFVEPKLNGVAITEAEMDAITKVEIKYKDVIISSALYPTIFDYSTFKAALKIKINIRGLGLEVGSDETVELIIYSADYPDGVVYEPLLELVVTDAALGDAALIDPLRNISLDDLFDVDTAGGSTGDVLTQQPDGSFALARSGSSVIDETLADDLSYSGPTALIVVGEAVAWGEFLYRDQANGKYYAAQANAVLTAPATRMALADADADETITALAPGGIARNDTWDYTDDGSVLGLYLSAAVAGSLTEIPDTTANNIGQIVAIPLAANIIEMVSPAFVVRY